MTAQQLGRPLTSLEKTLMSVAGCYIEITYRSTTEFTFSYEGPSRRPMVKLIKFFNEGSICGANKMIFDAKDSGYDKECDLTCLYYSVQKK
jgi:hypothetical protein